METYGITAVVGSLVTTQSTLLALGVAAVLGVIYLGISTYVAWRLAHPQPAPIEITPRDLELDCRDVAFTSRDDGVQLRGWLIPGIRPDGVPTLDRTLIAVHGAWQNRTDLAAGLN